MNQQAAEEGRGRGSRSASVMSSNPSLRHVRIRNLPTTVPKELVLELLQHYKPTHIDFQQLVRHILWRFAFPCPFCL